MTVLPSHPFGSEISSDDVIETLSKTAGWEDRYRTLIKWGKRLPSLDDNAKSSSVPIPGCESQVWLLHTEQNGVYHFTADSDARIVKGLLAVVLAASEGKSSQELSSFDFQSYFHQLGLLSHLSESRSNGLNAIVQFIKSL
ncbi:cysteine desulfurase sulfur acceptor subunit CsdE [Veronia nyctiphanis]|uniref:Cysteine desulfurase sulfur acceptor subunit CsdE n=1 Tax=Veronia nyctiphanis TaxID=1278244 RepID=A0A4Q0YTP2_9GAMM|nr:cysteine desulfurase sulfur acceptor subunit CsdE [Veronia nyctiphanis]RXJ72529.1 cysteine desulfurase sulfur acceptor subunit CsdE [Veronia nyctiphanis]